VQHRPVGFNLIGRRDSRKLRVSLDIGATHVVLCAVRSEAEGERRRPKGAGEGRREAAWPCWLRRSQQSASRPVGLGVQRRV
jgi:hypothetical protein